MSRYTVERELMVGGWLWQVLDTVTGKRSIPAALWAIKALAAELNGKVGS